MLFSNLMTPPLILIIDDDKDYCEVLSAKLNAKGFAVKVAHNGDDGVALARKHSPALILMDVDMPGKNGIATTLDLKQDPQTKTIKVIFVSNLGDAWPEVTEINRKLALQVGAENYFKKTSDLDSLVEKIRTVLAE